MRCTKRATAAIVDPARNNFRQSARGFTTNFREWRLISSLDTFRTVAQTRNSSVITFNFNPPALRCLLIVPALLAVTGALFSGRWYGGNPIAEYTSTPDADGIAMAHMATRWAPENAWAYWRLGSLEEKKFSADNLEAAAREYQMGGAVGTFDF